MKTAIFPGSFRPPHKGHYEIAKLAAKSPGVDRVLVLISAPSKSAGRGGIGAETSLEIWNQYVTTDPDPDALKINPTLSPRPSPIGGTFDVIADPGQFGKGDIAALVTGAEDVSNRGFVRAQKYVDQNNPGVEVEILTLPMAARGELKGAIVRDLISSGDREGFEKRLPEHLSPEDIDHIWGLISPGVKESALRDMIKYLITT